MSTSLLPMEKAMSKADAVSKELIEEFDRCGAVLIRGLLEDDQMHQLSEAVETNLLSPSCMAADYMEGGNGGRYFGDYCNWGRLMGLKSVALSDSLGKAAGMLMNSSSVRFFHEHVLVKEAHTEHYTPWHQDQPYYIVEGSQTISFWVPLDPVPLAVCPNFVAGSHKWPGLYRPRYFKDGSHYIASEALKEVPDFDAPATQDGYQFLSWDGIKPGDAIAFHFKTMHNAPANLTENRRRVVSFRYLGDDVRWCNRKHRPSPPYPEMGLAMNDGDALPDSWFPLLEQN